MITEMRSLMGSWVMKGLLVVIALTFVATFGIGTFSADKEVVARVNGEEILAADFLNLYTREIENLRSRVGEKAEQLAERFHLRENLLNRMITNRLLQQYAAKQRILVSDEELTRRVHSVSAFQQGGGFDFAQYQAVLKQNNLSPTDYEARLRTDMQVEKLHVRLQGGVVVDPFEVQALHRTQREEVRIKYAFVDPQKFTPAPFPSKKAIQEAYQKGGHTLQLPAKAKIRFFTLGIGDVQSKERLKEAVLKRYYTRHLEQEFTDPEKIRFRQVFVPLLASANAAEQIGAVEKMELAAGVLKKNKNQDFAALARKYSQGRAKNHDGDSGFVSREDILPPVAQAAFALQKGHVSDVVRSSQGLHLIKLEDRQVARVKPFTEVKKQIENTLNERRAERKLRSALRDLQKVLQAAPTPAKGKSTDANTAKNASSLQALAKQYNRPVEESALFSTHDIPPKLGPTQALMPLLKTKKIGATGLWQRNPVQGHVVYELVGYTPVRKEGLKTAQPKLVKQLQFAARASKARQTVQDWVLKYANDVDMLQNKIRQQGLQIRNTQFNASQQEIPSIGPANEVQKAAFGLSKQAPVVFVTEGKGASQRSYILWFEKRIPAKALDDKVQADLLRGLENVLKEATIQSVIANMRKNGNIEIVAQGYLGNSRTPLSN